MGFGSKSDWFFVVLRDSSPLVGLEYVATFVWLCVGLVEIRKSLVHPILFVSKTREGLNDCLWVKINLVTFRCWWLSLVHDRLEGGC